MKPSQITVDVKSLGKMLLTTVTPNIKNGVTIGYRYTVALPSMELEKFSVKIDGSKIIEPNGEIIEVIFDNLTVQPYVVDGHFGITGRATNIKKVKVDDRH